MNYEARRADAERRLDAAVAELDLTDEERRTFEWLKRWEIETVANVASALEKARES